MLGLSLWTTEIRFFAFKSKKDKKGTVLNKVLDKGRRPYTSRIFRFVVGNVKCYQVRQYFRIAIISILTCSESFLLFDVEALFSVRIILLSFTVVYGFDGFFIM